MTTPSPAPALFRAAILVACLASPALPGAHAATRNHDLQTIRIPAVLPAGHDHAPGPFSR